LITEWRREMMAAVVDPVGRNYNWSANCSVGGGESNNSVTCDANQMKFETLMYNG